MTSQDVPLTERIQNSYKQLSVAAINLNLASDELNNAIFLLEMALEKLNLKISAWARISGNEQETMWWSRDVGYTEIRDKWVIALRSTSGDLQYPDEDSTETWSFNRAPRWMQVEAIPRIPDLLDKLTTQAQETTKKLKSKAEQAHHLAVAMSAAREKEEDWRSKLLEAITSLNLISATEALEQPETRVKINENALIITLPKRCEAHLSDDDVRAALKVLGCPDLPFRRTILPASKPSRESGKGAK